MERLLRELHVMANHSHGLVSLPVQVLKRLPSERIITSEMREYLVQRHLVSPVNCSWFNSRRKARGLLVVDYAEMRSMDTIAIHYMITQE